MSEYQLPGPAGHHLSSLTAGRRHRILPHLSPLLLTPLFIGSLLVTACGPERGPADMSRETLASGIVRTTWHRLPQTQLTLDTLAVWDIWSETGEYVFGDIEAMTGGDRGFYLLDAGNRQVVLVDRQGEVQLAFGREGSGPGEFQYPLSISLRTDEIWVGDLAAGRYSVFDIEGNFLRSVIWPSRGGRTASRSIVITPDDRELRRSPSMIEGWMALIRSTLDGSEVDTIATMRTAPASGATINLPTLGATTMYDPPAYSPELRWAHTPDGRILTVTSGNYLIEERDPDGTLRGELMSPTPDLTVTPADREAYLVRLARMFDVPVDDFRKDNPRFVTQYAFAEQRAAIENITVDPQGRIWVLANIPENTGQRLDLFDADFTFLGSLSDLPLPSAFLPGGEALFRIAAPETGEDLFFVARVEDTGRDS